MQEQLQKVNDELSRLAHVDALTELTNRRGFMLNYGREWGRACRDSEPLSVVMIDIDSFKSYNDEYGHLAGDDCLRKVADAMASSILRPADILARFGGEEFILLLPNTNVGGALLVAERLRSAVENQKLVHEYALAVGYVTISLGVSEKVDGQTPEDFLNSADKNLYKAKESGRNQVFGGR